MLRLLGSRKTFCGGVSRRDLLHLGGAGAFAPPLCNALQAEEDSAIGQNRPAARAKSAIFLFLFGSPTQHETFDPTPDAPAEMQGV